MGKKFIITLVCISASVMFFLPAFSQEDMTEISNEAFVDDQRAPALFAHDEHNEKAELDDCVSCHHYGEDGKIIEGEDSAGMACSECHEVNPEKGRTSLINAYHQCKGCHLERGKGPVACGECHVK